MSDKDSIKRKEFRQLKGVTSFFDNEALPEVEKEIDEILEELDKELTEQRKIIAENDKKILKTMTYEEILSALQLVRVQFPGFSQ